MYVAVERVGGEGGDSLGPAATVRMADSAVAWRDDRLAGTGALQMRAEATRSGIESRIGRAGRITLWKASDGSDGRRFSPGAAVLGPRVRIPRVGLATRPCASAKAWDQTWSVRVSLLLENDVLAERKGPPPGKRAAGLQFRTKLGILNFGIHYAKTQLGRRRLSKGHLRDPAGGRLAPCWD